jgi:anti-sigma factor RsiW
MKCKEAYLHICDNLDADLDSARCREVRKHLASCPDCIAFLDSVRKTVYLYRESPNPEVPSATHKQLFKTIDLAWREHPRTRRRASR